MADLFCSFLDFRSASSNYYKLHLFFPSNSFSTSIARSFNSRITTTRIKPLLCKPAIPALDVISIHEHTDGSIVFRFGDPSEVVENVELEKPTSVDEEIESECLGESNAVSVLAGDHESEVTAEKAEREVNSSGLIEVPDELDSEVNGNKIVTVVDRSNESSDLEETELLVPVSSLEMEVRYDPEVLNENPDDSSLANLSVVDKISEIEITRATVASPERNIADATILQPVSLKPDNDIYASSLETIVTTDESVDSGHQNVDADSNNDTTEDGNGSNLGDLSTSLSEETVNYTDVSVDSEYQTVEAELQNRISEDSRESELFLDSSKLHVHASFSEESEIDLEVPMQNVVAGNESEYAANDIVTKSPELEVAINLSIGVEAQTDGTGIGVPNEAVQDGSDSLMQSIPVSPPLETQSMFGEEMKIGNEAEFRDDDRIESPLKLNNIPQNLVLETESTADDDNMQISQLQEESGDDVTELESTESATHREEVLTDFVLSSGAALLPHPSKVLTGGEDAYFVAGQTWLGVADGVAQWSLEGNNPGVYALDLMKNCDKLASDSDRNSISHPLDLVSYSLAETCSSGCSTVLVVQFDGQTIRVANVGDSGFIILRHGTVYKKSSPMLHAFHFPIQIEKDDDPSHLAELYQVDLEEEDVLITATDGLFDNLYDQEILSIVLKSLVAGTNLEDIADLLAKKAQEVGKSTSSRSPFADSAKSAGYVGYTGGKLDDVTVIVSVVKRRSCSQTL